MERLISDESNTLTKKSPLLNKITQLMQCNEMRGASREGKKANKTTLRKWTKEKLNFVWLIKCHSRLPAWLIDSL